MYNYTILIPLIPLVMFFITGLLGMKWKPIISGLLGTTGLGISWVLSLMTAITYFFGGHHAEAFPTIFCSKLCGLHFRKRCKLKWVCCSTLFQ